MNKIAITLISACAAFAGLSAHAATPAAASAAAPAAVAAPAATTTPAAAPAAATTKKEEAKCDVKVDKHCKPMAKKAEEKKS